MKSWECRRKFIQRIGKVFLIFFILISTLSSIWHKASKSLKEKEKIFEERRPWYFERGSIRSNFHQDTHKLWPNEAKGDRIFSQLMFTPKEEPRINKKIYIENLQALSVSRGSRIFQDLNCPVHKCEIVFNGTHADAIIFENYVTRIREKSSLKQVWILHSLESPIYSGKVIQETSVNWTASYRLDSDLVTPYDKWAYYDETKKTAKLKKNYAAGKTKKVAWFVSNCRSRNKRLEYAKKLQKYISVDIYGTCGNKYCPKDTDETCREMLSKDYKFYLSFENANCRDYITEKFYRNGLRLDIVPVVMGAPKEDYEKVAPPNSFIHVEDFISPKHLAEYLHFLDKNDDIYNSYFQWKGTGEFINTYFLCRLCALLHAGRPDYYYQKIMNWWRSEKCTKFFWNTRNGDRILSSLSESNLR